MQGGAESFNILLLKHEMPGQQIANNFLEVNAKDIRQYRNRTVYYLWGYTLVYIVVFDFYNLTTKGENLLSAVVVC